jgi:hypothetical protein
MLPYNQYKLFLSQISKNAMFFLSLFMFFSSTKSEKKSVEQVFPGGGGEGEVTQ